MNNPVPRRRRKEARPAEIIAAALAEFDAAGFANATLAGIARRAGISRTTIYLYFDSKEAIFEAAIRDSVERTIDDVAQFVASAPGGFRDLFDQALVAIYDRLVSGEASVILKTLVAEGGAMPDLVHFYRTEILAKAERTLSALVARGIAQGELDPACRDLDMRILIAPAILAAFWKRVFEPVDPLDVEAFRRAHARLICDALAAYRD